MVGVLEGAADGSMEGERVGCAEGKEDGKALGSVVGGPKLSSVSLELEFLSFFFVFFSSFFARCLLYLLETCRGPSILVSAGRIS